MLLYASNAVVRITPLHPSQPPLISHRIIEAQPQAANQTARILRTLHHASKRETRFAMPLIRIRGDKQVVRP